ncbi:MAG: zinc ribbon domain-containing protein [Rhodothermaceae bacterium]|nr:zinc ribbon domain-containing protein [Rhodothermaceae bacterium]
MPFYEYRCQNCGTIVEFRSSMDKKEEMASALECDVCESRQFIQVFSGIALTKSKNDSPGTPPRQGGCCQGGMCGM